MRALDDGPVDVVWTLRFALTFNTGAAFSQGKGLGPVIGILAAGVAVAVLWSSRSVPSRAGAVAVGLVVGGAVGNLVDRAFRAGDGVLGGAVVDFIDFQWYPVFNLADMAVVGGAILLLIATARAGDGGGSEAEATADTAADTAGDPGGDHPADGVGDDG